MYKEYEIKRIFAHCNTVGEVLRACEIFGEIIEDGDMKPEVERYARRESIVRTRQIKAYRR